MVSNDQLSRLISGPSKITTSHTPNQNKKTAQIKAFPVSNLPPELRHQIYTYYFASLPPIPITSENALHPLHQQSALSLSSPFFTSDIPPAFYYHHATFIFSAGKDMAAFSQLFGRKEQVMRIEIRLGRDESPTRDWVYLMISCFERLDEVAFSVSKEEGDLCGRCGGEQFGVWWSGVRDAVREGVGSRGGKGGRSGLVLRTEDGEWGVCERVGGC